MARKRTASSPNRGAASRPSGVYFDEAAGQRAVDFFAECLTHIKGEFAGRPFILEPWQERDIIRPLFGWKRPDGSRRYRTAYVEIPRKNGKSSMAAGVGLYLLSADGEPGAEVYSAASDREQAAIVFGVARGMRDASPELRKRLKPYVRALVMFSTGSSYKVLSADAPTKHGFNAHGILFDELHAQPTRELYDVLTTSTGARRQPLTFITTTAGYDRHSICWEVHDYACKVRDGIIDDASFLPVIYAAATDDRWDDPAVWARANPGLGVSVKPAYLEQQAAKARESLAYQNTFRRLHLNQWTEQAERAIDMDLWDACATPVDRAALRGRRCFGGLDLATTTDVAACVLLFPDDAGGFDVLPFFWVPGENIRRRVERDRVPYTVWAQQGYIKTTEGNVIDYDVIRADVAALAEEFDLAEIGYDRWNATQLVTQLQEDGATMVPIAQGFQSLNAPTKDLLKLVAERAVRHGGHPVLRWMANNLATKQDPAGNLKPDKGKSAEKIDGVVALIMALARAIVQSETKSVYESRGAIIV
jgi:phage terminase large subunit-like protein